MNTLPEEIKFAQCLVSNQIKVREKALRNLGKYFKRVSFSKDSLSEEQLLKLWKGIFYYFWNCDKPLIQEERAETLSKYIHVFQTEVYSYMYLDTFLQTMAREWFTIDRYRLDKFMMLVRKFLHETFVYLKNKKWNMDSIKQFRKVMKKNVVNSARESAPLGLKLHITEIYAEELAKVGSVELPPETVKAFIVPFCNILCTSDDTAYVKTVAKEIFIYLINQEDEEEDDDYEGFPVLKFDSEAIQNLLMKYASKPGVKRSNMKVIYDIVKQYRLNQDEKLTFDH